MKEFYFDDCPFDLCKDHVSGVGNKLYNLSILRRHFQMHIFLISFWFVNSFSLFNSRLLNSFKGTKSKYVDFYTFE